MKCRAKWRYNVPILVAVPGDVFGDWAAFQAFPGGEYSITHVPSGKSLRKVTKADCAYQACELLAWSGHDFSGASTDEWTLEAELFALTVFEELRLLDEVPS